LNDVYAKDSLKPQKFKTLKYDVYRHFKNISTEINTISTFVSWTVILSKFFYSTIDALVSCLKNNIKMYIKNYIKTAPTCFSAVTPSSGGALFVLAKVTVIYS
jgi:hypothetical protein